MRRCYLRAYGGSDGPNINIPTLNRYTVEHHNDCNYSFLLTDVSMSTIHTDLWHHICLVFSIHLHMHNH
jgi:hypothetical protein